MEIRRIFETYVEKKEELTIDIDSLKKHLHAYRDKIILYGAGSAGIAFFHYLKDVGIMPAAFSDGDKEKHGRKCEQLNIISPEQIVEIYGEDALVIVTINTDGEHYCRDFKTALLQNGHKGVHKTLENLGCKNVIDYVYFCKCNELFRGGSYNLPACADVDLMYANKEKIENVYYMLEDEASRRVFSGIVEYRMLHDDVNIPTISEKKQYFEYELFPKIPNECFVDCGACGGSSLKIFLEENKSFDTYYGFEPDSYNYRKLQEYVEGLPHEMREKIHIFNQAVYDSNSYANFFLLSGPGSFESSNGTDIVRTSTIDSVLEGCQVSYIKMNIEGSEIPALRGAEAIIKKCKPRLAIMGYHKTSDLWEVPSIIKQYRSDYRLSLVSYMKNVAFCYMAY